jgi:hypothetical protein
MNGMTKKVLPSKSSQVCLVVIFMLILITTIVFEYYQNLETQRLLTQATEPRMSVSFCQIPSMRIYHEPGRHLQNGTFVYSRDYDTISIWTLIDCNVVTNLNYSLVGVFSLVPVGFAGPITASYIPQAFTVYQGNATYQQQILLYLPSLGANETRNMSVQLIILVYTTGSVAIAGFNSAGITETS